MQRFLVSALFLLSLVGTSHAQTIKITTANGPCTYPTGAVTQDASVPGQLLATASGAATGTGCGSTGPAQYGAVTYVASPLTLTTAATLPNSGGSASFTFQPVNADHCTGTITPSTGTAFTTTFCSSLAGCQTQQSVTATFPANPSNSTDAVYTVSVSCTGPGSTTAVASPASPTVTVPKSGTVQQVGCTTSPTIAGTTAPSGFLTVNSWTQKIGNISASYFGFGSQNVDSTSLISLFNLPQKPVKAWPGTYNADPVVNLPINQYLSLGFNPAAPPAKYFSASNVPNPLYGEYQVGSSSFTATVSMTISTSCGDFGQLSPTTVVPGCVLNKGGDSSFFRWENTGTCVLHDNQQYYLNVINADISSFPARSTAKSSVCPGSACTVPLINGPGDWNNYTPN